MEPPNATAVWPHGQLTSMLESISPRLKEALVEKEPGWNWLPKKVDSQHSEMVAALRGKNNLARARQMQEPQAGGVPRSVLQRLLAMPSAPNSPMHSPRRQCSAASSASIIAMVHSPRAFANSDNSSLEKRDSSAETAPYHWCSPTFAATEVSSYESSSSCSSHSSSSVPVGHLSDHVITSDDEDDENINEVIMLRQLVALLVKSLEHEKKRRASEQHLMQKKIIELQSLIRANGHEDDHDVDTERKTPSSMQNGLPLTWENEPRENYRARRWSAPVYEDLGVESAFTGCLQKQKETDGEAVAQPKLTQLRAQMHVLAIDSERETQTLRAQLESGKRGENKQQKELTLETTVSVTAPEQKHAAATILLAQQAAKSATEVGKLEAEKLELIACMQMQEERLKQLELALGKKQIVDDFR